MTENEIVARASYIESLFRQDMFNTLVGEFKRVQADAVMTTQPHELKTREAIYARVTGLQEFLEHITGYVAQRDEMVARQKAEDALRADGDI